MKKSIILLGETAECGLEQVPVAFALYFLGVPAHYSDRHVAHLVIVTLIMKPCLLVRCCSIHVERHLQRSLYLCVDKRNDCLSGLGRITSWFPGLLVVIQDVSNDAPRCRRSWWRN